MTTLACKTCGAELVRKRYSNGELEPRPSFAQRRYCNLACMGEARRAKAAATKVCCGCGKEKPLSDFYKRKRGALGREGRCKVCVAPAIAKWTRRYRERHPGENIARVEAWRRANPEKERARLRRIQSNRRARLVEAFIEDVDPQVVYERDGGVCGICGEPANRDDFHVDHVIPLRPGPHAYSNVQVAHPRCNRRKGRKAVV